MLTIVYIFFIAQLSQGGTIPSSYKTETTSEVKQSTHTSSKNSFPVLKPLEISTKSSLRKQKGPNIPLSIQHHQILVPNLHVIPIQHHIHTDLNQIIGDNKVIINQNVHGSNNSHTLIPVLIPIHNLVPLHDLTVIPLHRVDQIRFNEHDEIDTGGYRNPLGGYGAGWGYGGHGAGHGFHYAYG